MLKPNGKKIGVTELNTDWSSIDLVLEQEEIAAINSDDLIPQNIEDEFASDLDTELDTSDTTIIDLLEEVADDGKKHDSQVQVNEVWFHKSTILKQTFNGCRVSKDRLRRVQGLSKHVTEKEKDLSLDDILLQGDVVIYIVKNIPILGSVSKITKGGKKVKLILKFTVH